MNIDNDYVFIVREDNSILVCQDNPEWPTYVCDYKASGINWYIDNEFERRLIKMALAKFLGYDP